VCIHCQAEVPLANYFFWPRRCPACGKRRDWGVWLVELVYMIITPWLWLTAPVNLGFWPSLVLLVYLGVVVVIDTRYRLILHQVSLVGAALGLAIGFYLHGLTAALAGGALGFGVMFLLYKLGEVFLKWMARRRGESVDDVALGFGDVNLSGVLGLLLGFPAIIVGLFLAIFIGGAASLLYLLVMVLFRRYKLYSALPYGPWLVAGAVLLLFFPGLLLSIF
jgi:leader peptidase (prepilin peptidase)/N-methyltransferase